MLTDAQDAHTRKRAQEIEKMPKTKQKKEWEKLQKKKTHRKEDDMMDERHRRCVGAGRRMARKIRGRGR